MSEAKTVKVRLSNGVIKECLIECSQVPPWKLRLFDMELGRNEFVGRDLFEALNMLRRELESVNAQLICAGARRDVFPSGMSRGMGGGRKVYITQIGQSALGIDLVGIFDDADLETVGTVDEQIAFHEQWIKSLRTL